MRCNPAAWFKHGNHPKGGGFRRFHVFVVAAMVLGDLRSWGDWSGDHACQGSDVLRALVRSRNSPGVQEGDLPHSGHQSKRGPQVGLGTQQHHLEPPAGPAGRGVSSFAVSHGGQDDGEVNQEEILTGKGSGRVGPRESMSIESKEGIPYGDLGGIPVFTRHEFPEEGSMGGKSKGKGGFPGQVRQHDQGLWHGDPGQPPRGEDNLGGKGQEGKGSHSFPPSPSRAKKGLFGMWSTPESPLRSLIRPAMRWFSAGMRGGGELPMRTGEPFIPMVQKTKKRKRSGFKAALEVAKDVKKSTKLLEEFDDQFTSSSSRAPKESRRKLVKSVLESLEAKGQALPLTAKSFKFLGAVLWKANYKSAELYLTEAKLMHVEMGFEWTAQLDLMMKRCKRGGAARDRGPRNKAPEVGQAKRAKMRKATLPRGVKVLYPKELFVFAMVWMLREVELSKFIREDIKIREDKKFVSLRWRKSKMDQKGLGTTRVLTCLCQGVTGHSARSGWTIPQVAYLGRWSSSIIYSYAQALESLPVNSGSQRFGNPTQMAFDENGQIAEAKNHVESLELEIAEFKRDSKNTLKVLKKEINDLSKNFGTKRDGPPRVQGLQSGLVHENNTPITSVPPLYWRTRCGWSFKYGNFCFVPAEKQVTCSKCLGGIQPALTQGGELGSL